MGIGGYLYINNQKEKPSVTQTNPNPVNNDVAPGGNRATLTLADGSKIVLDSVQNGTIAKESNATVSKSGNQIVYSHLPSADSRLPIVQFNTMATPRGGQYQLTLPDGSQVWLNAESSITYPTAFTGNERKVTITGEAYFEVRKDKTKPFIVSVSPATGGVRKANGGVSPAGGGGEAGGGFEIEVLGTKFNVNAYKEEPAINTTLLEGSVKLSSVVSRLSTPDSRLPTPDNSVPTSLILKPGQQGQLSQHRLTLAANPNIDQVMAWKNGVFDFQNMELETALRQIARWYDVEVIYATQPPKITLGGGLGRDLKLSQVLKMLEGVGVTTRIENKKLYISQ